MGDMRSQPPSVSELYENLTEPERKFLTYELTLSRCIPASLTFMRAVPYPLSEDTTEMIAKIVERYVYPWPDLHSRYLTLWVRGRLSPERAITELPAFGEQFEVNYATYFPDPDDLRDYRGGTDFTYGLAGIRDAEFEEECDWLQQTITAAAEDMLCDAVPLPLPFGPPSLTQEDCKVVCSL